MFSLRTLGKAGITALQWPLHHANPRRPVVLDFFVPLAVQDASLRLKRVTDGAQVRCAVANVSRRYLVYKATVRRRITSKKVENLRIGLTGAV